MIVTPYRSAVLRLSAFALAAIFAVSSGFGQSLSDGSREVLGRVKARSSGQIASSPWGIQTGTLKKEHLEKAAAIGVKWTRLQASWREIEKERGVYLWEDTDRGFAAAIESGITPFVCLAVSNRLYCQEAPVANARETEIYGTNPQPPTKDPAALAAWLRFVRATVERYKDRIHYWEVWNEPNHWAYWGAQPDGSEYGMLLRETARVIRSVDPSAKIIGGALANLDPVFTEKFLAAGTAELIDIITFHNYAALPEERIYKAVDTWAVINSHNPKLELWQGECGYPSHSSTRDYRGTSPWGVNIQAKWLLRQSFTDLYFCRTTLSNYFKLVHNGGVDQKVKRSSLSPIDSVLGFPERGGSRVKSVGVNEKCLLGASDLSPKPGYFAYQNLCAVFDNRYKPITCEAKVTVTDPGIFYGVGENDDAFPSIPLVAAFRAANDAPFIAYWLPWHPQELIKEGRVDLRMNHVKFREPVLIDLLAGTVHPVVMTTTAEGSTLFHDVPLADYPWAIAEKSEVTFTR